MAHASRPRDGVGPKRPRRAMRLDDAVSTGLDTTVQPSRPLCADHGASWHCGQRQATRPPTFCASGASRAPRPALGTRPRRRCRLPSAACHSACSRASRCHAPSGWSMRASHKRPVRRSAVGRAGGGNQARETGRRRSGLCPARAQHLQLVARRRAELSEAPGHMSAEGARQQGRRFSVWGRGR